MTSQTASSLASPAHSPRWRRHVGEKRAVAADRVDRTLDRRRVDLWTVRPDAVREPRLLSAYRGLLSRDENAKSRRFFFERDRHRYLVTRALVRTVLSRYAPVDPRDWTFRENRYGRPEIEGPLCAGELRFNVSHTEGFIACLVGLDRDVGVDVEDAWRRGPTVEIADRYFSGDEVKELRSRPFSLRRDRFFEYWTLKESYIKARGMGLSIPLDHFSFQLPPRGPIRISFQPQLRDDAGSWQFALLRPTERHVLAVGIRRGVDPDLHIALTPCIPLFS